MRENLHSLHYVLKGLKTLSRSAYDPPPPTDFVLIDYEDSATFDAFAGYYHPAMKTVDGRVIPSSDGLLSEFLKRASWRVRSVNQLTIFEKTALVAAPPFAPGSDEKMTPIGNGATLVSITKSNEHSNNEGFEVITSWRFEDARNVFPWMLLQLSPRSGENPIILSRGLCGPQIPKGDYVDHWHIVPTGRIPDGSYDVKVSFVDNPARLWSAKAGQPKQTSLLAPAIPFGEVQIEIQASNPSGK